MATRHLALLTVVFGGIPARQVAQTPAPVVLEDLLTTVARTPLLLGGAGLSWTILDGPAARRGRGVVGIDEALAFVPGVVARDRGDRALEPRVAIRGAGARANFGVRGIQVLVDGVPATLADGQATLTFLDLDLAEQVGVARGPLSALHGNGAQGILAIATPSRARGPWQGRLRTTASSRGGRDVLGSVAAGGTALGGVLTASRSGTDGVRDHAAATQYRVRGALDWRPHPTTAVILRGAWAHDPRLEAPGALTAAEFAANPRGASPTAISRNAGKTVEQRQFSLALHRTTAHGAVEVTTWVLDRQLGNPLALAPATASDPRDGTLVEVDRAVVGLRAAATRRIGPRLDLTAGLDAQRQVDDRRNSVHRAGTPLPASGFLDQRQQITATGPFVQLLAVLRPGITLRTGARHDRITFALDDHLEEAGSGRRTMAAWSGGAALARSRGNAEAWLGIATAFETPTTTELAGRPDGRTGINDLLDPARTTSVEAGLRWRRPAATAEVVVWRATTRDAITPVAAIDGRSIFANVGGTRVRGIEVALTARLGDRWRARMSGTVLAARFDREARDVDGNPIGGHRLPGVPRASARLGVSGALGRLVVDLDQGWSAGLDADDSNTLRVAGWGAGITAAAVRWSAGRGLAVFAAAHNLFDRAHVASVVVGGFGGRVIEPGSGRVLRLGAELQLAPR